MKDEYETQKICNITDYVTKIRYKVIYRSSADRYEIWTQFRDDLGKLHRNRITFVEAISVEADKDKTIAYVNDYLVANHINIYEDKQNKCNVGSRQSAQKANGPQKIIPVHTFEKHDCKDLEQLFKEWRKAQSEEPDDIWKLTKGTAVNISKDHFRRDGIIDEEIFRREKTKILFISSEANDDEYSAKYNDSPSTVDDYISYHLSRHDDWKGKMRERLSELYKVLSHTERNSMDNPDAALHFAVMDINKRGGGALVANDNHIENYCKQYASFIRNKIEIINLDIVAIIGTNLYNMDLHGKYLGAIKDGDKDYFVIDGKSVPILSLWQTAYYQGRCGVAKGYEDNKIIGKQVAKVLDEMRKYGV